MSTAKPVWVQYSVAHPPIALGIKIWVAMCWCAVGWKVSAIDIAHAGEDGEEGASTLGLQAHKGSR